MSEYDTIDTYDIENSQSKNTTIKKKSKLKNVSRLIMGCILLITILLYCIYNEYIYVSVSVSVNSTALPYARLPMHHHHKKTCDDYKYGCCEVIDNNNIKHTLSVHKIHKHDEIGSNCPTLNTVIHNYVEYIEEYYSDKIINCKYNNCCEDYGITIPTKVCPSVLEIIRDYNIGYPNPDDPYIILIILMVILLMCSLK